jgi:hypothetical protein
MVVDQTTTKQTIDTIPNHRKHRTTSSILQDIADEPLPVLTMRQITDRLGNNAFGLILLLFALPNSIPLPIPGVSTLTSLPLIFFALQMCLGRNVLWIPSWVGKREVKMDVLQPFIHKSLPWVLRLEKLFKPRLVILTDSGFNRLTGFIVIALACLLALPIPLGNLPLGVSITIMALAITERDGAVMIGGWIASILSFIYLGALISGYAWVIWKAITSIL